MRNKSAHGIERKREDAWRRRPQPCARRRNGTHKSPKKRVEKKVLTPAKLVANKLCAVFNVHPRPASPVHPLVPPSAHHLFRLVPLVLLECDWCELACAAVDGKGFGTVVLEWGLEEPREIGGRRLSRGWRWRKRGSDCWAGSRRGIRQPMAHIGTQERVRRRLVDRRRAGQRRSAASSNDSDCNAGWSDGRFESEEPSERKMAGNARTEGASAAQAAASNIRWPMCMTMSSVSAVGLQSRERQVNSKERLKCSWPSAGRSIICVNQSSS
ncbi:hypothetical protein FB451DRAFT_1186340 [Mycena latifolia]|nr:hypothetical protein FB451DRAFT_1186340 [Mycena latifolia]